MRGEYDENGNNRQKGTRVSVVVEHVKDVAGTLWYRYMVICAVSDNGNWCYYTSGISKLVYGYL